MERWGGVVMEDVSPEAAEAPGGPKPLTPDVIVPDLRADDKWGAIHEIVAHFRGHPDVEDAAAWEADVVQREKLCPTLLRPGVALPHARTTAVKQLVWGVALSKAGVAFEAPDAPPAHLILLIGVPPFMVRHYLRFVSRLAQWIRSGSPQAIPGLAKNEDFAVILQNLESANRAGSSADG